MIISKRYKIWTNEVEPAAMEQINNVASMSIVTPHLAVMPDVHAGYGCTVGSVIPTYKAIIPGAVGVDIGCGMIASKTNLKASQLPENLSGLRNAIEDVVPVGNNARTSMSTASPDWVGRFQAEALDRTSIRKMTQRHWNQLGTLGGGNHFIELCIDQNQDVWIMLHSGSRGIGNEIGREYIEKAKEEMKRWCIHLPDYDLAYLAEGSQHFNNYVLEVEWAQDYARVNRDIMMAEVQNVLTRWGNQNNISVRYEEEAINCHHNYVSLENHYGKNLWIARKGAVRARKGDLGIIPGSMGAKSFIVQGRGCAEAFNSCSHGAGRKMSRTEARKVFSLEDHIKATKGIECRKDEAVIDETPGAYKDIDEVMANQSDLVDVLFTLKQVMCIKG